MWDTVASVVEASTTVTRGRLTLTGATQSGATLTLPAAYKVGSGKLFLYYNGLLCFEGSDRQYTENWAAGSSSQGVTINFGLVPEDEIDVVIWS